MPEFQPAPAAEESRPLELLTALGMLAFSVVVLVATQGIESRVDSGGVTPRWWPTILASTMLVLSLVLLVGALRTGVSRGDLKAPTRTGWIRAGGAIVLSAAFLFAWSVVPFVIACAVYIACLVALFGGRSVVSLVVVPVG
ncbi:MAG: tripartite tricarboxylate transporter TctB family protein, partial [Microbacterium sp.]